MSNSTITETRVCTRCYREFPITEFRLRRRDSTLRFSYCRQCHNEQEKIRKQKKSAKQRQKELAKGLTRIRRSESRDELAAVVKLLMKQFGGPNGFIREYRKYAQQALADGGYPAFRLMDSMLRMLRLTERG